MTAQIRFYLEINEITDHILYINPYYDREKVFNTVEKTYKKRAQSVKNNYIHR